MNDISHEIIKIISSALLKKELVITEDIDWDEIYCFAKKQQILVMVYYGLCCSETNIPQNVFDKIEKDVFAHTVYSCNQLYEVDRLCEAFEENGIDHMVLKGSVLKKVYPKPEMRQMSDSDILIKVEQVEKITKIMNELGYTYKYDSDHEIVWVKQPSVYIELHKRLIPSYNKDFYSYYGDGWKLSKLIEGKKHGYTMSKEDNYIYNFTHFAKHYRDAGVGVKHMIDLFILQKDIDLKYVKNELKKLQLYEFYKAVLKTIAAWFEGADTDIQTQTVTKRIFAGGAYGTAEAKTLSSAVKATKDGTNAKNVARKKVFKMLFPSVEALKSTYPILNKTPFLLPAVWVWRWITALLFRRKNISVQSKTAKTLSAQKITSYQDELNIVGLDFNFEE